MCLAPYNHKCCSCEPWAACNCSITSTIVPAFDYEGPFTLYESFGNGKQKRARNAKIRDNRNIRKLLRSKP